MPSAYRRLRIWQHVFRVPTHIHNDTKSDVFFLRFGLVCGLQTLAATTRPSSCT